MAKRLIEFYQKESDESFLGPVKIGSSGEYVTLQEGETKTLKKLSDQIGNPENLTPNVGTPEENQKSMVTFLNETSQIANDAYSISVRPIPDDSITQQKLKSITISDVTTTYPNITNDTIGVILGKIKKYLTDLYNNKLNNQGGSMTGNLILTDGADIVINDTAFESIITSYLGPI